jgi:hyperosmotically inducible periplasmic protein
VQQSCRTVLRVMCIAPAIVFAVAVLIVPVVAAADTDGTTPGTYPDKFQQLDTNHDGFISRSEVKRYQDYGTAFDEADENHDGRLDRDEFVKAEAIYARIEAGEFVDDSVITAKVKAALMKEPKLKSLDVSVETYRGQVLLSGFVDSTSQRAKAMHVAASIEGVHGVKDGMAVR